MWHTNEMKKSKEVKTMFPSSSQQPTVPPKMKPTLKNVRKILELLGMKFLELDKWKARQNSKERRKQPQD